MAKIILAGIRKVLTVAEYYNSVGSIITMIIGRRKLMDKIVFQAVMEVLVGKVNLTLFF